MQIQKIETENNANVEIQKRCYFCIIDIKPIKRYNIKVALIYNKKIEEREMHETTGYRR